MFSRHRRFYEIRGKYFVCSDRWIWDRCGWDSTSPTNPIDLSVKYEDFLESSKYTASLPWIRYSAFTDATLLRYYFWSHHIYFSERWLSWKHCIVVFVAFFYVKCPEPLNTICHRMTGTFWKFQMDFSPCANNDDSLSSAGQHFLWNEFQHMSKRGSCYILNGYFECTNGTISLRTWYIVPCS